MGSIARFKLGVIQKDYNILFFFETGTFRGDGVLYARKFPFDRILSSEIVPEIAIVAKKKFENDPIITIFEGDSISIFEQELAKLNGNCVFWLDAHFPGADAGMTAYDKAMDENLRLPLALEISTIKKIRPKFKDVFIIDDLRIYEDGPYEKGNVPPDALPKSKRNIDFIYQNFASSHHIYRSYEDEGYIIVLPKPPLVKSLLLFWQQKMPNRYMHINT